VTLADLDPRKKIRKRREELGLTESEIAERVGISIYEYGDIEQHANELVSVSPLNVVRKLCNVLNLDMMDLLEIPADGSQVVSSEDGRDKLIRSRMETLGMSEAKIASRLGYEDAAISQLVSDPSFLETWPIESIARLAVALRISPTLLIEQQ